MNNYFRIALALFLLCYIVEEIKAQYDDKIYYNFSQTDSTYTFYGTFHVKVKPECLLDICFKKEHIEALAVDAKDVSIVTQGENWNRLSYTYIKLKYFENQSVWQRTRNLDKNQVDFVMLSSKNSHSIMPKMIKSSGYYKMTEMEGYSKVEYFQKCELSKVAITNLQMSIVKKGASEFLYRFKKYALKICVDNEELKASD